ncbi:hypothetical protein STEG23_015217 [Scotinomys teguina]
MSVMLVIVRLHSLSNVLAFYHKGRSRTGTKTTQRTPFLKNQKKKEEEKKEKEKEEEKEEEEKEEKGKKKEEEEEKKKKKK